MGARAAGAHLAAIKAKFAPDPTARGIKPGCAYPAVTKRCRPDTLRVLGALEGLGTTRARRAAVGAALVGVFGAL